MTGAGGLRFLAVLAVVGAVGCADLELPHWVPFQGPASDQLPGVMTPAERKAKLRALSQGAVAGSPEQRQETSRQLALSIRAEKDPLMRLEIVRALGRYPGPTADAVLKAALSDVDAQVRRAACEAWGRRGDAQAVALLGETLHGDIDADVRLAAAKALGDTKGPQTFAALAEALEDTDPAMQYRAVLSLEKSTGQNLGHNVDRWRQHVKATRKS
jgi:HEAT repeat protein